MHEYDVVYMSGQKTLGWDQIIQDWLTLFFLNPPFVYKGGKKRPPFQPENFSNLLCIQIFMFCSYSCTSYFPLLLCSL
ncbi:hypothetical protein PRUPE_4G177300 [Prunus persica]|uniref:Uncharacterized protein n=1 Tax=Prunus persica TaxID=3760 RepID=M5X366_PRUPE|nr:hypothetical protein PRUPE_4G177300 [Prunus persica]